VLPDEINGREDGAALPVAEAARGQALLDRGTELVQPGGLHHPVTHRRHLELSERPPRLGKVQHPQGRGSVAAHRQLPGQPAQLLPVPGLEMLDRLPINARASPPRPDLLPSWEQPLQREDR